MFKVEQVYNTNTYTNCFTKCAAANNEIVGEVLDTNKRLNMCILPYFVLNGSVITNKHITFCQVVKLLLLLTLTKRTVNSICLFTYRVNISYIKNAKII